MDWTPAMTDDRRARLHLEACHFFGVAPEELRGLLEANVGVDSHWNWIGWALWEWEYGWIPDVAEQADRLGVRSALDFGAGAGEAGLHLADSLDVAVTFCDLPGPCREFLCWRLGARYLLNTGRPRGPEEIIGSGEEWDCLLCLEVLEHIPAAPQMLRLLLARTRVAVCVSGALGRDETDRDPLHVYRESLLPVLQAEGWGLWRGGGMPWWFVRREVAQARGLQLINPDGQREEPGNAVAPYRVVQT